MSLFRELYHSVRRRVRASMVCEPEIRIADGLTSPSTPRHKTSTSQSTSAEDFITDLSKKLKNVLVSFTVARSGGAPGKKTVNTALLPVSVSQQLEASNGLCVATSD